jgi:hypothetical protein
MIYVSYFDILRSMPKKWQATLDPRQNEQKIEKNDVKETPVKTDTSR